MRTVLNYFYSKKAKLNNNRGGFLYIIDSGMLNKGKFPRNRQLYKTGVFWSIALSVISILGLQILFYKSVIIFSYVWILFFSIFLAILCANFIKLFSILKYDLLKFIFKNTQPFFNLI